MHRLLPCLLIGLGFTANAQNYEFTKGPISKFKKTHFNKIIHSTEDCFYTFGGTAKQPYIYERGDFYIQKHSLEDFSIIQSQKIEAPDCSKDVVLRNIINGKEAAHIFFSCRDDKNNKADLIHAGIKNGEGLSAYKIIFSLDAKKVIYDRYSIQSSRDSSKIMILATPDPDANKARQIKIFDENFDEIWSGPYTVPNLGSYYYYNSIKVDNEGNVLTLGYLAEKGAQKEYQNSNLKIRALAQNNVNPSVTSNYVLTMIRTSGAMEEFYFKDFDKIIHSASFEPDFDGGIAVTGFYSDVSMHQPSGVFYIRLDSDNFNVLSKRFHEFKDDFLGDFDTTTTTTDRIVKGYITGNYGKDMGFEAFQFDRFIKKPDGTLAIIGEHSFYHIQGEHYITLEANDIVILDINENHSINRLSHIPKKQKWGISQGKYSPFLSYYLHQDGSTLHFLFNDHANNFKRRANNQEILSVGGNETDYTLNFAIVMATLYPDGEIKYQELDVRDDTRDMLLPHKCYQINNSTSVIDLLHGILKRRVARLRIK